MPKDASKNVDRYKVRGGHLNEYDFEKEKAADKKQDLMDKKSQKSASQKSGSRESASRESAAQKSSAQKAGKKK